jgi:hypothetical protein
MGLARFLALWLAATLILSWPLAVNRGSVLFPDSIAYIENGAQAWRGVARLLPTAPTGAADPGAGAGPAARVATDAGGQRTRALMGGRSYFYGAFLSTAGAPGLWAATLTQAAWAGLALLLALPWLGIRSPLARLAAIAALATLGSVAFFAAVLLPDLFAPLVPLSLALLIGFGRAMPLGERLFWLATLVASLLFHKSFFAFALPLLVVAGLWALWRRPRSVTLWPAAVAVLAALVLTIGTERLVERMMRLELADPPFLLARGVGDGLVGRVLAEECVSTDPPVPFVTCRYLPYLPLTENDLLWSSTGIGGWQYLPDPERRRMSQEQAKLVAAVLERYPADQVRAAIGNGLTQLVTADVENFAPMPDTLALARRGGLDEVERITRESLVGQGRFPLVAASTLWRWTYAAAFLLAAAALLARRRLLPGLDERIAAVLAFLLLSLLVSAAATGILAGPIARYQARMSWLALLAAIVLLGHRLALQRR